MFKEGDWLQGEFTRARVEYFWPEKTLGGPYWIIFEIDVCQENTIYGGYEGTIDELMKYKPYTGDAEKIKKDYVEAKRAFNLAKAGKAKISTPLNTWWGD